MAASVALVMAATLGGATPARGGTSSAIEFSVELGSCVMQGHAAISIDAFTLVVRDGDGQLKDRIDIDVPEGGYWGPVCVGGGPLRTGDTVRGRVSGQTIRLLVLPRLTINVDRVTDIVTGKGPSSTEVQVAIQPCFPGVAVCLAGQGIPVQTGADGAYEYDATFNAEIDGWGGAVVRWVSPFMDQVFRFRKAPYLLVEAGRAGASGLGVPGDAVHVRLRRDGEVKGTGTDIPGSPGGGWQTTIRKDGHSIPVRVGDRVTSDLAADASLLVRAISIVADLAADSASGQCYPDGPFGVRYFRPNGTEQLDARGFGFADGMGDFSETALSFLQSGWSMRVLCANAAGDTVRKTVAVP